MTPQQPRSTVSAALAAAREVDTAYNRSFDANYRLFGWLYRLMMRRWFR